MNRVRAGLFAIAMLLSAATPAVEPLRISWGSHNAPPYALVADGKLVGGVIHDIGNALGKRLQVPAVFVNVPRARYEEQLLSGAIDLVCITHPDWVRQPAALAWSPPLFSESDIIVQPAGTLPWASPEQLAGKRLGTILGFRYPALEAMFTAEKIRRDDASSLDSNLQRLQLGRVDAVVDANIPVYYWLIRNNQLGTLPVAGFTVSRHDVHCAISRQASVGHQRVVSVFTQLVADGTLNAIVSRYLRPD